MQVNHGKAAPLRRVQPGDGVVYYSPTIVLGSKVPYRAFTAVGVLEDREPYLFDMGGGFRPWRRDVRWWPTEDLPASAVLARLSFAAGRRNWASGLRFGLMAIPCANFDVISEAMREHRSDRTRPVAGRLPT